MKNLLSGRLRRMTLSIIPMNRQVETPKQDKHERVETPVNGLPNHSTPLTGPSRVKQARMLHNKVHRKSYQCFLVIVTYQIIDIFRCPNRNSPTVFSGVRVTRSLVLCVCFVDRCLSFFCWPLCCLVFFGLRNLITPLVSSNSSSIL